MQAAVSVAVFTSLAIRIFTGILLMVAEIITAILNLTRTICIRHSLKNGGRGLRVSAQAEPPKAAKSKRHC
jgi:hypothetical protein